MGNMPIINRVWAMPSHETFTIKPIADLISRYVVPDLECHDKGVWIDPFARNSVFKKYMKFSNDIDPKIECTHCMDALEFLNEINDNIDGVDGILFDPPYSPRQIKEQYESAGLSKFDTTNAFYSHRKDAAAKLIRPNGMAICFGWSSSGFGKKNGFRLEEILLVCHGGNHNDTIVTVERKS